MDLCRWLLRRHLGWTKVPTIASGSKHRKHHSDFNLKRTWSEFSILNSSVNASKSFLEPLTRPGDISQVPQGYSVSLLPPIVVIAAPVSTTSIVGMDE